MSSIHCHTSRAKNLFATPSLRLMWLRSVGLLSRRQPLDLHPLLHTADTEAQKKPRRVAAPVLKELLIHAQGHSVHSPCLGDGSELRGEQFLVRATCRRSALNMKPLVGTHCILFHGVFCPSAPSSASSGALPKREKTDTSSHIKQAMYARSKWPWRFPRTTPVAVVRQRTP